MTVPKERMGGVPVTIEDVALAAEVSVTTVSHVFSGNRPVSAATQARVRETATRLGYRPSAIAKSLQAQRTETAMIVLPDITNPFYPDFARGAQDVLRAGGYHSLMGNTDGLASEERAFLEEAHSRRVDGVIFVGFRLPAAELSTFADAGLAVVSVGPLMPDGPIDTVRFDDEEGARMAVAHLLETHEAVAFINGESDAPVSAARRHGYDDALRAAGREAQEGYVISTGFTRAGGRAAMRELLAHPQPPSAVFCANDLVAIGAMDVIHEHGLRVPANVAVVGCDDIELAGAATPPLTTVRHPAAELGRQAAALLLSRMTKEFNGPGRHVISPTELVVRRSS